MKFKNFYNQSINESTVDIFDDVKKKASNEIYKVIDIISKAGENIIRLAPTGQKNPKEIEVSMKVFKKEYIVI